MTRHANRLAALIAVALSQPLVAHAQPTPFAQLPRPNGIAVDSNGNVFVVADATTARVLAVFDRTGAPLGQVPLPGTSIADIETHNLAYDPVSGILLDLKSDGTLLLLDPSTGEGEAVLNIRTLPVDVSAVFDVATGTIGTISGIVPEASTYGDIAILSRGEVLDLLVSGRSVVHPFVMRLRFEPENFSARVLVSTNAPESAANQPRGVAVSAEGLVLTTVPIAGFGESVYAFSVDFPETGDAPPVPILEGVLSSGMTTDDAGNFYITGQNVVCTGDTSALIVLFAALDDGACVPSGGGLFGSGYDVAVSPVDPVAFTTVNDAVLAWPLGQ